MPGGDGTGPLGMGPRTGRAAGYCAGYPEPGYTNPIPRRGGFGLGRGLGRGRGWFGRSGGRGWRNWYSATGLPVWLRAGYGYPAFGAGYTPEFSSKEEAEALKEEAGFLKEELQAIQERLDALEKAKGSKANE
jgi:hypothetical protein